MPLKELPEIEGLVQCATQLAILLARDSASDARVRQMLEDVLWKREAWKAAQMQLITEDELINLILAHLCTFLGGDAKPEMESELWENRELRTRIHGCLFISSGKREEKVLLE